MYADINGQIHGQDDAALAPVVVFMDDEEIVDIFISKDVKVDLVNFGTESSKAEIALNRAMYDKAIQAAKNGEHLHVFKKETVPQDFYIVINNNGDYEPYGAKCVNKDTAEMALKEALEKDPAGGWIMEKLDS